MPRVSASNGVRPEIRALAVMKLNKPVTPTAINEHVNTGDYAAKYVSFLNTRYGFEITAQKEDRKVVTYTILKEPKNIKELRELATKGPKAKEAPAKAAEKAEPKPNKAGKKAAATNGEKGGKKKVNRKFNQMPAHKLGGAVRGVGGRFVKKDSVADALLAELGMQNSGEVGNFAVDPGWDSMDGVNVRELIL